MCPIFNIHFTKNAEWTETIEYSFKAKITDQFRLPAFYKVLGCEKYDKDARIRNQIAINLNLLTQQCLFECGLVQMLWS